MPRGNVRSNLHLQSSDGHLKPADIDRRRSTESLSGKQSYHVGVMEYNIYIISQLLIIYS